MSENQLLYFNEYLDIYWHGALMGLAILFGSVLFWIFARRIRKGAASPLKYIFLFGFPLAIVFSRLEYCWFRQDEFRGGLVDILDVTMGGFGLIGAMLGVALVMVITGAASKRFTVAELFDAASPAAAAAICIGRMASYFSGEERGFELYTDFFRRAMFTVYSAEENKTFVSVFQYESIAAGIVFIIAIWTFDAVYRRNKFEPGMVTARFLLGFTVTQIVFESWRSDTLFLVHLGFVRFNQAACAIALAALLVVICVKYAKKVGFRPAQIGAWVIMLLGIALAFLCEFFMTGGNHLQNYFGMIVGLGAVCITAHMMMSEGFAVSRKAS